MVAFQPEGLSCIMARIHNHSQRPYINFIGVPFSFQNLGSDVVRCATERFLPYLAVFYRGCNSEICNFDRHIRTKDDITGFQAS